MLKLEVIKISLKTRFLPISHKLMRKKLVKIISKALNIIMDLLQIMYPLAQAFSLY